MRHFISVTSCILCVTLGLTLGATSTIAQTQNATPAMKNFKVTSPNTAPEYPVPALTPTTKPKNMANILKPLSVDNAIKPLDDITEFEFMSEFLSLRSDERIARARTIVTERPDAVPPLAYYYLARALADKGDFDSAVFYFYVAELRNEFDKARFPVYQLKKPNEDKPTMRTPNQIGAVPTTAPRIVDPRSGYNDLIKNLGKPIRAWIVKHPDEFRTILARVKLWDAATPYAYRPPYDISGAVDIKTWPTLLSKTRSAFFATQLSTAGEIEQIEPFTTPRPFGR